MRVRLSGGSGRTITSSGPLERATLVPLSHGRRRLDIQLAVEGFNTLMLTLETQEELELLKEVLGERPKETRRRRRPARGGAGEDE